MKRMKQMKTDMKSMIIRLISIICVLFSQGIMATEHTDETDRQGYAICDYPPNQCYPCAAITVVTGVPAQYGQRVLRGC